MTSIIIYKINKTGAEIIHGMNLRHDYVSQIFAEKVKKTLIEGKVTRSEKSQPDAEGNVFLTLVIES